MSNLEHLLENSLHAIKYYNNYEDWREYMQKDVNWEDNTHFSIDDLWTISQYIVYTYMPIQIDEVLEDYGL